MPPKQQPTVGRDDLERDNTELREENARLRAQLADAQAGKVARPAPVEPSFGMCEGVRADLEQVPATTDPFTGKKVTRDDVSDGDARIADADRPV